MMPMFVTIGYGDQAGYDRTPRAIRDVAHEQDAQIAAKSTQEGRSMTRLPVARRIPILIACLCAFLITPVRAADDLPLALLTSIDKVYQTSDGAHSIPTQAKAALYFTPEVARLIAKDTAEAAKKGVKGEVGNLDFDPFVGSQDWEKTKIALKVDQGSAPDWATGSATFKAPGESKLTTVKLDLAKTPAGWRIADIHWEGQETSLVGLLEGKG